MWRWQQPRLSNKHKYLGKLLLFSSCVHSVLCFLLLFMYTSYHSSSLLEIHAGASDVIVRVVSFLPQQKSKKGAVKKTAAQLVSQKKKTQLSAQKKPVVKPVVKKEAPQKKSVPVEKKEVQKKEPPKPIEQKQEPVAKQEIQQKEEKVGAQENIKYVTPKELNDFELQTMIQNALVESWAPPAGMANTLVCRVSITVDWNGAIIETIVKESSGVLVYDVAVEQALDQLKPPRQMWGKTIQMAFKP